MPTPITIPRLGWNMEEGIFHGWLKQDGDAVRAGDALFRLEAEKATEDIECLESGVLQIAKDGPGEGDTVPVGLVIGQLLREGESPAPNVVSSNVLQQTESSARKSALFSEIARPPSQAPVHDSTFSFVNESSPSKSPVYVSPRARRVARELGIDWSTLQGTGRNGRIRERDVRAAVSATQSVAKTLALTPLRRTAAERLLASARSTVPVTLTTTVDVTNLMNLRQQFQFSGSELVPSVTDFFVKLTALVLEQHPHLAARWAEDHLVLPDEIHIGIAVDSEAGLRVPVVRQAAHLGIRQLAAQTRDLIERARDGKLGAQKMQGGVFTITNLGMFDIDAFTPIINPPECAILGIGRVRRVPVFVEDKVVAQEQMVLSLTFDHRIVDGAPAARFLQALGKAIENPGPWLVS